MATVRKRRTPCCAWSVSQGRRVRRLYACSVRIICASCHEAPSARGTRATMLVFISWSGSKSRQVAEALRLWLRNVIQAVDPWMSSEDIDTGSRWSAEVAQRLDEARVGIICITPDNMTAPWLLFEAGALSKSLDKSLVCPYLLGLRPTDLEGPMVQFHAAQASIGDTLRLLQTVNRALGPNTLPEHVLNASYAKWWPELESSLKRIESVEESEDTVRETRRTDRRLIEETLQLVRDMAKRLENLPYDIAAIPPGVEPSPGSRWPATVADSAIPVDSNLLWSGGPGPDGRTVEVKPISGLMDRVPKPSEE